MAWVVGSITAFVPSGASSMAPTWIPAPPQHIDIGQETGIFSPSWVNAAERSRVSPTDAVSGAVMASVSASM